MPMQSKSLGKGTGWSLTLITLAGLILAAQSIAQSIEGSELLEYLPRLLKGAGLTIFLAGSTFLVGFFLSLILLFLSYVSQTATRIFSIYQSIIRSTPLLAQLYLVYYGAGSIAPFLRDMGLWWIFKDPLSCVLIVFLINTTAYQSYILMGSVSIVAKSQREAGLALGLTTYQLLCKILLPQAFRVAIKPLGNELVGMIKASSVASVVTVYDLLGSAQSIYNETFNLAYLPLAGIVYIFLVELVRVGTELVSKRFAIPQKEI